MYKAKDGASVSLAFGVFDFPEDPERFERLVDGCFKLREHVMCEGPVPEAARYAPLIAAGLRQPSGLIRQLQNAIPVLPDAEVPSQAIKEVNAFTNMFRSSRERAQLLFG